MKNKSYHNCPVPSADLVLDLIRSAPETDSQFLFTIPTFAKRLSSPFMRTTAVVTVLV